MKRNFYHNRRRLRLEQLEPRQLLAGDVTVSVVGGTLFINGDSGDNSISISATANADEFTISSNDGGDTTINGGAGPVTLGGATGGIDISLSDGNDWLEFNTTNRPIQISGDLDIALGDSSLLGNSIEVVGGNGITIAGDLVVRSDGDFETLTFENVQIAGGLEFDLGPNDDIDALGQIRFEGGSIGGDVRIDTYGEYQFELLTDIQGSVHLEAGTTGDQYRIESSIGGSLTANLYQSHLNVANTQIAGDMIVDGIAWITVENSKIDGHVLMELFESQMASQVSFIGGNWASSYNSVGGNFVVTFDGNNTSAILYYLNVENDLVIRGGEGIENAQLNNVRAGNSLLIDTGAGNDVVWIHNSSADGEAAILAGAGSDYVLVGNFLGARSLFVDTAAGFDLVSLSYASFGHNLYVWVGGDSDQATVYAASAKYMSIDAGSGFDSVTIQYSVADHLFAGLGDGNDSLAVIGSLVRASALFDGGAGHDILTLRGNLLTGLTQQKFESISQ
jgi:hypothetical protein